VLSRLGVRADGLVTLKDDAEGNGNWRAIGPDGTVLVIRRYARLATAAEITWEHDVLRHLAGAGWTVPVPVGDLVSEGGRFYCLNQFVPGCGTRQETTAQQQRRGQDLARLHLALRGLDIRLGQRPGWRALHEGATMHTSLDLAASLDALTGASPRHGAWLAAAVDQTRAGLAAAGASELPLLVVHGDFTEWNVHYVGERLAGVLDFGLAHVDSRPFELAIARTYRAPAMVATYRAELARLGWPLTEAEVAAIGPVYRAFRVDMALWPTWQGLQTGRWDLDMIERQLARTGTAQP
jgi:Ser/Thr protein kinase RdoA (MazF antagonist)